MGLDTALLHLNMAPHRDQHVNKFFSKRNNYKGIFRTLRSMMKVFVKIVNNFKALTTFANSFRR